MQFKKYYEVNILAKAGKYTEFLYHCPHRSWQIHPCRPHYGGNAIGYRKGNGSTASG